MTDPTPVREQQQLHKALAPITSVILSILWHPSISIIVEINVILLVKATGCLALCLHFLMEISNNST